MSVDAIESGNGWALTSADSNWPSVLSAAAGVLGLSTSTVTVELRSGASLSFLAQAQGVSQDALAHAIAGALSPSTLSATTPDERLQIAAQIAQRAGGAPARYTAGSLLADLDELERADVTVGGLSVLRDALSGARP